MDASQPAARRNRLFWPLVLALLLLLVLAAAQRARANDAPPQAPAPAAPVDSLSYLLSGPAPAPAAVRALAADPPDFYRTAPADLPRFTVTKGVNQPAPGYIFVSIFDILVFNRRMGYLMILDNNGEPVFYRSLAPFPVTIDFKQQPDGRLTYFLAAPGINTFFALNNQYEIVGSYKAGNGYTTDLHDLQVLPNGNALLLIHDTRKVDLGALTPGGRPDATVIGCLVQEVDPAGNVVFEWNAWDHPDELSILDTIRPLEDEPLRYIHCNSIEQDTDGNLLLSNRNLSNVVKINRATGQIMWLFGGKKNQFAIPEEDLFFYQHDARRIANGHLTVYDNRFDQRPRFSRGIEYAIDEQTLTATLVKEYRGVPDVYSGAMGNMQRLPNGHTVIGWGRSSQPIFTEFGAAGNTIMTLSVEEPLGTYRAFRFRWEGDPQWPPVLAMERRHRAVRLYFSWNGATDVARYAVFGGQRQDDLQLLGTAVKSGFETTYDFTIPDDGPWYFRVVPIDNEGQAGPASNFVTTWFGFRTTFLPLVNSGS